MKHKLDTVLLVDDDFTVNYLHAFIINGEQLAETLEIAETGEQALDLIRRLVASGAALPNLILLDLNMPKMDGWKFIEEYKKLRMPQQKEHVLIILSSSANPDDKRRAEQIKEVAGFYNKPLTAEMLRTIMRRHF